MLTKSVADFAQFENSSGGVSVVQQPILVNGLVLIWPFTHWPTCFFHMQCRVDNNYQQCSVQYLARDCDIFADE